MSASEKNQPDFSIEITPRLANLAMIRRVVNSLSIDLGLSDREALQLEIAVDEACANSIKSVLENPLRSSEAKIRLEISIRRRCLRLSIFDAGKNLQQEYENAAPLHEKTDRTRIKECGPHIVKTFMDEVRYIHEPTSGNRLILTKYLQSIHF
ncbi:MAG: ATP-binding protein [Candidatus Omnitrophica bacterium]|nr:ATP-binding protein [Candidatus Omnitrophota bacterium]